MSTEGSGHPSVVKAKAILADGCDPRIGALINYWLSIHPGDRLPGREDFEPLDVPRLLSYIVLTDVERDPLRFRFRLIGTSVVHAFEEDSTGCYMDEVFDDFESTYTYIHRKETAETGLPTYRRGISTFSEAQFRLKFGIVERINLPLADDGETVNMILTMLIYMANDD